MFALNFLTNDFSDMTGLTINDYTKTITDTPEVQ